MWIHQYTKKPNARAMWLYPHSEDKIWRKSFKVYDTYSPIGEVWQLNFYYGHFTKSKSSRLSLILDESNPFEIDKCKSKNGASVSKVLALFN